MFLFQLCLHCTKNHIFFFKIFRKVGLSKKNTWKYDIFFKCFWKIVSPKKLHWNMIYLAVLSGKVIFLFPGNRILFFRRKIKDDLSKKIHGNMTFSSNVPKRWSFHKKSHWNMIFLVLSGKMGFFSENMIFFLWTENERWSFPRNTWKYDIFCIYV